MDPDRSTLCAHCRKPATMKCGGCIGAPQFRMDELFEAVYCDGMCQKAHWPDHKTHCKAMKQRKVLFRGARLLKVVILTYREVLYDIYITRVEFSEGYLQIHQKLRSIRTRSRRGPFPSEMATGLENKEVILALNQCTTAMALLVRLTRKLFVSKFHSLSKVT
jgi:hypothetical protein